MTERYEANWIECTSIDNSTDNCDTYCLTIALCMPWEQPLEDLAAKWIPDEVSCHLKKNRKENLS